MSGTRDHINGALDGGKGRRCTSPFTGRMKALSNSRKIKLVFRVSREKETFFYELTIAQRCSISSPQLCLFFIRPERKPLSTTECKDVKVWLVKVAQCVLRSNIKVYHE